jgi:oligopeptide/dipeptide ABC transporter ATP-binding protein
MPQHDEPLLSVSDLVVEFDTAAGPARAVDGMAFTVRPHELLCIVGESGSGKSVTMLAAMGLLPPSARIASGQIRYKGRELNSLPAREMRRLRGRELAMIFQDPMTSLNPTIRVGKQVGEIITLHEPKVSKAAVKQRVIDLLTQVNIPRPEYRYSAYPHQFSGGMRQRAMIAMAMAHSPALLIADEPTTALDVTIQAQILEVLRQMRERTGSAMVLITHDLGVVAETADRVVVMYSGRVMETGTVQEIFHDPQHPYTIGLLAGLLDIAETGGPAYTIPGQPPALTKRPPGCPFHPRCALHRDREICRTQTPVLTDSPSGRAACHFATETEAWATAEFPDLRRRPTERAGQLWPSSRTVQLRTC